MDAFEVKNLARRLEGSSELYLEFLRTDALSAGVYRLDAGAVDPQDPHNEEEVYYVVSGRARITVSGETRDVGPGSVVGVAARAPHRFHDISEPLTVLVLFAPPETGS